jgi:hypothetical protein
VFEVDVSDVVVVAEQWSFETRCERGRDDTLTTIDDVIVRLLNDTLSSNTAVGPLRTFRYLQTLGAGDLCIRCSNARGPFSPVEVVYSLIPVQGSGVPWPTGTLRRPVQGAVGELYVSGQAGMPGQWIIRWRIRDTYTSPVRVVEQRFQVLDAVKASGPAVPGRIQKYGWE